MTMCDVPLCDDAKMEQLLFVASGAALCVNTPTDNSGLSDEHTCIYGEIDGVGQLGLDS